MKQQRTLEALFELLVLEVFDDHVLPPPPATALLHTYQQPQMIHIHTCVLAITENTTSITLGTSWRATQ
jgi:hypothetical protein